MYRLKSGVTAALFIAATAFAASATAQQQDVIEVARNTLAGIQNTSFVKNREFCGLIGRNGQGNLVITRPRQGSQDGCRPKSFFIFSDVEVLASYHTHGAYIADETVEVPSTYDLDADADEGIYGFVATPGGRFWIIEPEKDQVRMLCGMGCLPRDPNYDVALSEALQPIYTGRELETREAGG
jgi:hypothetical protein